MKLGAVGDGAERNYALYEKALKEIRRRRRMRRMKLCAVGEGAQ